MTEQQKHFPEFYVTAPQPCPYLPGRQERKLFTHLTQEKPAGLIDNLLRGGFRRSQNIAYMPYCEGCQACVSVRVVIDEFVIGRSMRRVLEKTRRLEARRVPPEPTSEHDQVAFDLMIVATLERSGNQVAALIKSGVPKDKLFPLRQDSPTRRTPSPELVRSGNGHNGSGA